MVRDYVLGMYGPMAARSDAMTGSGYARARSLAAWKHRVSAGWPAVEVVAVDGDVRPAVADLGATRKVGVVVALGDLDGDDVDVELLHGPVGPNDELTSTSLVPLTRSGLGDVEGTYRYEGSFVCERAGRYGIAVRVVPARPDLITFAEMDCVAWA
jgi:starch phosphorylase